MNIFHVLTAIFVIAKVTGYLDWSWWLVLLPSIAAFSIAFVLLLFAFIVTVMAKR